MVHPITPPDDVICTLLGSNKPFREMIIDVARWGADQELEACCEVVRKYQLGAENLDQFLQQERRPSESVTALEALDELEAAIRLQFSSYEHGLDKHIENIRAALHG